MPEGVMSYEGLSVPLFGESEIVQQDITKDILTLTSAASNTSDFLVLQNSSGSELFRIEDDARIWMSVTKGAGDGMALYRYLSSTNDGQKYSATFLMDESTYSVGGGRTATLNLRFDCSGLGEDAAKSFINFDDHGTDCPTFITIPNSTPDDGSSFVTNTQSAATHALKCYIGGTLYYLMITDTA